MAKQNATIKRARNYGTIVYPESAPENWQEVLSDQHVPAFISPLHDQDINPDGTIKKEHYHVMLMFDGVKTPDQAKEIFDMIGGVGMECVQSIRGYARYLCHMDNPEKAQYDTALVRCMCGADYPGIIGLSIDRYKSIGEMMDFVVDNGIVSYSDLLEYARLERYDWFRVLCDNATYVMYQFIKSRSWAQDRNRDRDSRGSS